MSVVSDILDVQGRVLLPAHRTQGENRTVKQIVVVGAVIVEDGHVFCTQRGPGNLEGFWEFPGGKLEPGESPQDAVVREIREELDCLVDVGDAVITTTHAYDFGEVTLTTYYCTLREGRPELSEHTDGRWMRPHDLHLLDWAPADIPAVRRIQDKQR